MAVILAVPWSIIAHSSAVCQCSSRTPPAVSLMFTPAMDFETGSSRTVTSRDHPPSSVRLVAKENGYLKFGTKLLESVQGGHVESGFCASRPALVGPGSVALLSVVALAFTCLSWAAAPVAERPPTVATKAAELTPRNPRRET